MAAHGSDGISVKEMAACPIIIIGMHRSGTSMISRILEDLGLFMGRKKQKDYESLFFLTLNNWLMQQCGGAWDQPQPVHVLLEHREARSLAAKYLRFIMKTPRLTNFLGWKYYLQYRNLDSLDFPWGWKDPRNTFTLPLWLDIFPSAKIIHIYRNGVDVANSLYVRERARFNSRIQPIDHKYRKLVYLVRSKKGGFADSLRCSALEEGFSLWEEYLNEARAHIGRLEDRAMEIKYEDFLADPYGHLHSLTDFCGLSPRSGAISEAADSVRKARAYAYRDKPELQTFAENVLPRLKIYGY